jgi:hypothetical protein
MSPGLLLINFFQHHRQAYPEIQAIISSDFQDIGRPKPMIRLTGKRIENIVLQID